ncbi:MAG: hypothetical protein LBF62_10915 [Tannerellaceae bacterium]|jgi:hypothetical protein|nr:hypothetical protein [Tannerellaceae bacterium]
MSKESVSADQPLPAGITTFTPLGIMVLYSVRQENICGFFLEFYFMEQFFFY